MQIRELASGLEFPEGPVWMPDGSIVLVEIKGGRVTRVGPDGSKHTIATPGGGPNGAAIGPDGKLYDTIANGLNQMGSYGANLAVQDRWAIVAYVRTLQLAAKNPAN